MGDHMAAYDVLSRHFQSKMLGPIVSNPLHGVWAVFFNELDIPWLYQPKTFTIWDCQNGEFLNQRSFTPTFYLPLFTFGATQGIWTIIHPDPTPPVDMLRFVQCHDFDGNTPIWHLSHGLPEARAYRLYSCQRHHSANGMSPHDTIDDPKAFPFLDIMIHPPDYVQPDGSIRPRDYENLGLRYERATAKARQIYEETTKQEIRGQTQ